MEDGNQPTRSQAALANIISSKLANAIQASMEGLFTIQGQITDTKRGIRAYNELREMIHAPELVCNIEKFQECEDHIFSAIEVFLDAMVPPDDLFDNLPDDSPQREFHKTVIAMTMDTRERIRDMRAMAKED